MYERHFVLLVSILAAILMAAMLVYAVKDVPFTSSQRIALALIAAGVALGTGALTRGV